MDLRFSFLSLFSQNKSQLMRCKNTLISPISAESFKEAPVCFLCLRILCYRRCNCRVQSGIRGTGKAFIYF